MFFSALYLLGVSTLGFCATYNSINDIPELDWDFIIVGEAGPTNEGATDSIVPWLEGNLAQSRFDWNFTTVSQRGLNGRSIAYQRGHMLGGSSSVSSSSDFGRFARVTRDPGWSWNSLQPYIKRHEKFENPADNHDTTGQFDLAVHGFTGNVAVTLPGFPHPAVDAATLRASKELGGAFEFNLDMNSGTPLGLGWLQSTIGHNGTRSSATTSYLDNETRSRKNLHIVTDKRVARVLKTPGTKDMTIRTVEIRSSNSSKAVILTASKEVILAAGTIGSPHILLHSGIGDKNDLEALGIPTVLHNPSVGRNLSDHPTFRVRFAWAPNSIDLGPWANVNSDLELQARALELWKANRTGPFIALLHGNHLAWMRLPDNSSIIDKFGDTSSGPNSAHIELVLGSVPDAFIVDLAMLTPSSRGSVTTESRNPFDDPLIDLGFYTSAFDLATMREAIEVATMFTRAPVWENVITGVLDPLANATTNTVVDGVIRNGTGTGLHSVGTASMSPKDENWGVVDPDLLVKKVSGLRIVDASIMPYVPCAHTQVPVYIIAERAADIIRKSWA
ncbi:GMC oxidoreductase [Macrolepiota fuliginosa MF-IS2]|uniref:pyranose dehydrogenase (acceptor) n=1 Tax=Macrolepiota fuliginosa MF-IS2 TaxID=1400762 RepID=A0A9P5XCB1_9AGAR|nr:GMC oxidoreductase [Macrolepiota fuliginosa MF-IS2]